MVLSNVHRATTLLILSLSFMNKELFVPQTLLIFIRIKHFGLRIKQKYFNAAINIEISIAKTIEKEKGISYSVR